MATTAPPQQAAPGSSHKPLPVHAMLGTRGAIRLTLALLLGFLQGCPHTVVQSPAPLAAHPQPPAYRIQPGDQLEVKVYHTPELNESVTVRPDGRISVQLAHDIPAAGLTPAELTSILNTSYARELNHPDITVVMRTFDGQRVFVDGEVNRPSQVPLAANLTILQSITIAGGLKETASPRDVILIRRQPGAQPQILTLDLTRVLDGTDTAQDLPLMPMDVVYVHRSAIANVNLWVAQYLRNNLPATFSLTYQFSKLP